MPRRGPSRGPRSLSSASSLCPGVARGMSASVADSRSRPPARPRRSAIRFAVPWPGPGPGGSGNGASAMRTAFYQGARRFTVGDAPLPTPGPEEALLRVRRVGICGTDLHIFQGHLDHRVPRGGVIGHETFAEVVEAPRAGAFRAGDRVVVEPVVRCGACRACRMGASYLCYELKVLGV